MAQVTYRVDDLDGKTKVTGDSTVLSLNGRTVSIDLSPKNVEALAALLAPYFENGVELKAAKRASNGDNDKDRNAEIRAWAAANGHTVNERGRLPKNVVDAFTAAVENHANENGKVNA